MAAVVYERGKAGKGRSIAAVVAAVGLVLSSLILAPRAHAVADTWVSGNQLDVGRAYLGVATALDGRVFAFGGNSVYSPPDYQNSVSVLGSVGGWTAAPSMTVPRSDLAVSRLRDGRMVVIGGLNNTTGVLDSVELFSPATNSWVTDATLPAPRRDLGAA